MLPACAVHRQGQSLAGFPSGTYVAVAWTAPLYDPLQMCRPTDISKLVVPAGQGGLWKLDALAAGVFVEGGFPVVCGIAVNGVIVVGANAAAGQFAPPLERELVLADGDAIQLLIQQSSGRVLTLAAAGYLYPALAARRVADTPDAKVMA